MTAPVFEAVHAPVRLRDEAIAASVPLDALAGLRVSAVSALADNSGFVATVASCGAEVVAQWARRDHHRWSERELRAFASLAVAKGATALVTTEKDAVKMRPEWVAPLPLWSVCIEMQITNAEERLRQLIMHKLSV